MQQTPKNQPASRPESKGHPDSGREKTELELEKGMPPNQKRGPQDKTDRRPAPDKADEER